VVERAVVLASSDRILPGDLPEDIGRHGTVSAKGVIQVQVQLPFKEAKEVAVEEIERAYIEHVLENHDRRISHVAEHIGIDRRSLYRLLERHGIDASELKK